MLLEIINFLLTATCMIASGILWSCSIGDDRTFKLAVFFLLSFCGFGWLLFVDAMTISNIIPGFSHNEFRPLIFRSIMAGAFCYLLRHLHRENRAGEIDDRI